ncbi:flagellar FlbD family protein [Fusibacter sp. JL298sf-3]
MIKVTRLNGDLIYINDILIEFIEETPDTMITLTTGKKIIVKENTEVVINKIIEYQRQLNNHTR